jgi:hypothetical protein
MNFNNFKIQIVFFMSHLGGAALASQFVSKPENIPVREFILRVMARHPERSEGRVPDFRWSR